MQPITKLLISIFFISMWGCAPHTNKIVATSAPQTQVATSRNCTSCLDIKEQIRTHFFLKRDTSFYYNNNKTKIVEPDSIYYSDINLDSFLHTPIVQQCFKECYTLNDVRQMFYKDSYYVLGNYQFGIVYKFTHRRIHPQSHINGDSEIGIGFDSLGNTTSLFFMRHYPTDRNEVEIGTK
ncbi:hypothetical protein [Flavobacterium filum]|uniref:hypothetical protein n=1 Tax=Flavobacterium filum TaxID=370974 RepID=UPI0023F42404|nr:hypothetical protein [Flavobacterium filum]